MQRPKFIKMTTADYTFEFFLYGFMIVFGMMVLFPFLYLLALSFNQGLDAIRGGIILFPRKFTVENYALIFSNNQLLGALSVSVLRTVSGTSTAVLCTALAGYIFTKENLVGHKFYMAVFLLPMYITAGLIPTYLTYKELHLTNSFLVYIIPNLVWGTNIIIMRTFFKQIPSSLQESAWLDGAGDYTIFFRIILPLSMPVVATIGLFNAVWQWNSWFDTMLFTRNPKLETLVSLLARMMIEQQSNQISVAKITKRAKYMTPEVLKAAMTIITTLPIIMVYPFLQKHFVKGVMIGAVKG